MKVPALLRRYVLDFETRIERSVTLFGRSLPPRALVLDAGAGECQYKDHFFRQRYVAVDLAIGDPNWNYSEIDAVGNLAELPFPAATFDAALNVVTLEHVQDPPAVLEELARVLKPRGRLLLVVPHEWEVHQHPNDYYRYTTFGLAHLLSGAGFRVLALEPAGGYFRLLSRRLLSGYQFFPTPLAVLWLIIVSPLALFLPILEPLDRRKDFTLGYIAVAERRERR